MSISGMIEKFNGSLPVITMLNWNTHASAPTGHAAIAAGDDYLSFHPVDRQAAIGGAKVRSYFSNYDDDIYHYGQAKKSAVANLDEDEVVDAIRTLKRVEPEYHILGYNCCTVSLMALKAGIHEDDLHSFFNSIAQFYGNFLPQRRSDVSLVDQFGALAGTMPMHYRSIARASTTSKALFALLALLATSENAVDTPADVVREVERINNL